MRALSRTRPHPSFPLIFTAVVLALVIAWPGTLPARAADARLESAQADRVAVEARLGEVLARLDAAQAALAEVESRVDKLRDSAQAYAKDASSADDLVAAQVRDAYKRGRMPSAFALLNVGDSRDAVERARLMTILAMRNRAQSEFASGARVRAAASAREVAAGLDELEAKQAELDGARADVQAALAEAEAHESQIASTIAEEQAARERAAAQRASRQASVTSSAPAAPDTSAASAAAPAPEAPTTTAAVSGGIACPVGNPRNYSDTYGAPRSGGRSHMGVDILAPMGTPSYAYEDGVITSMAGSSLGGISLYMRGDSGNTYYYTHLNGYAASSSVGKRVTAGELIAYVGDTGNAAGIPHLHWEVMPGGGSNVNPYPYALRACG